MLPNFRVMPAGTCPPYHRLALWRRTAEHAVGVDSNNATHWLMRVRAPISPSAFSDATRRLVSRHQALRTIIEQSGELPSLRLLEEDFTLPICVDDLTACRASVDQTAVDIVVANWLWQEIPTTGGLLWKALCLKLGEDDWIVGFVLHHLISDGQSMRVLSNDFFREYALLLFQRDSALPPAVGGLDFFAATDEWLNGEAGAASLRHWMTHLKGVNSIPPPEPAPPGAQFFAFDEFDVHGDIVNPIKEMTRRSGATPFITLMALQYVALSEMFSIDDFTIAAVTANRELRPLFNAVGFLADRVFYRIAAREGANLESVISTLLDERRISWPHRYCPSDWVKRELSLAGQPISSPSFNFTPLSPNSGVVKEDDPAVATPLQAPPAPSTTPPSVDMPYRLVVKESLAGWRFRLWVSRPDMVEFADRLKRLLDRAAA